ERAAHALEGPSRREKRLVRFRDLLTGIAERVGFGYGFGLWVGFGFWVGLGFGHLLWLSFGRSRRCRLRNDRLPGRLPGRDGGGSKELDRRGQAGTLDAVRMERTHRHHDHEIAAPAQLHRTRRVDEGN